jgi:hypothetical protein
VAGGDVEDGHGTAQPLEGDRAERRRHRRHHRGHAVREFHPHRIVRLDRSLSGEDGMAGFDDLGEAVERLPHHGVAEEVRGRSDARRRTRIEEQRAGRGVNPAAVGFLEQAVHGQEIAQDPHAALGRSASRGERS